MTIRPLTESDVGIYQELRLFGFKESPAAFGSSYEEAMLLPVEEFGKKLRVPTADGVTLGAFDGDLLVGVAGIVREEGAKQRHKAWLLSMYVRPSHRRRGIARRLMKLMLDRARGMADILLVKLTVSSGNTPARALYEDFGFRVFGTEPWSLKVDGCLYDEDLMALKF